MDPQEVVAAPYTVYLAATGTAFPAITATPSGSWFKLGTSGDLNYGEDGVTLALTQNIEDWHSVGSVLARKAWRTSEVQEVRVPLADMDPYQLAKVMDAATVNTISAAAGVAGQRYVDLDRGIDIAEFALLARGISSLNESMVAQLEIKRVYQAGDFEIANKKGEPAMLETVWRALAPTTPPSFRVREQFANPA
jgi:hypothetical protein